MLQRGTRTRQAGPVFGRERECRQLDDALDWLSDGSPTIGLIELTGDPGIGKTRLLTELMIHADRRDLTVCAGQASWATREKPYAPFTDALDGHLEPSTDVYRQVRRMLEQLAVRGLVVVLDDMHWADPGSIALLGQLLRRPPRAPVLLATAHRWRQAPLPLLAALAAPGWDVAPVRIQLPPLDKEAAAAMITGSADQARWQEFYRDSGGNPFYLNMLQRWESRPGRLDTGGNVPSPWDVGEMPQDVATVLLAELAALSAWARQVAQAAAVAGGPFSVDAVASITGLDPATAQPWMEELVACDIIRPLESTQQFAFRHWLVQCVVYQSANPAWRIAAHARAAQALEASGAPVTALASHVERCARFGDREAVCLLADAARAVAGKEPLTAARWLRTALRLLPEGGEPRAELLYRLGYALGVAGLPGASRDVLHEALRLLPGGGSALRASLVALCAAMERHLSHPAEGRALLRAELSLLQDQAGDAAAAINYELACSGFALGEAAGLAEARQSLTIATWLNDKPQQAAAHSMLAVSGAFHGDIPAATAHLAEAAGLVDALLDGDLSDRLDTALWVGWTEFCLDRPDDALRHLTRGVAVARDRGRGLYLPQLLIFRSLVLRAVGRLAEAAVDAAEAAGAAHNDGQHATALAMVGWIAALRGKTPVGPPWPRPNVVNGLTGTIELRLLAETRLLAGGALGCRAFADLMGGPTLSAVDPWSRVGWYELLTRAELADGGDCATAEAWARRAIAEAAMFGLPGWTGLALLAQAQVLVARRSAVAIESAVAARQALTDVGLILDSARARLIAGMALTEVGELGQAAAEFSAAAETFAACGADALVRLVATERRRRAARSPRVGLDVLTRREREVAFLVSEGLTNGGIARRLYITEKTVEMHVSHIFAKLNASSRAMVAAAMVSAHPTRRP